MAAVHFEGVEDILEEANRDRPTLLITNTNTNPTQGVHINTSSRSLQSSAPSLTFGTLSKRCAFREIRQARKTEIKNRRGWDKYNPKRPTTIRKKSKTWPLAEEECEAGEHTHLVTNMGIEDDDRLFSSMTVESKPSCDDPVCHWDALKEMFLENKINVLFVFLPLAYWSHASKWNDGYVFILNFLAMVPLASMLGVFTEELAAHTNDVIGGLLNATFGNAVELVVAVQALLANDFRVVQASLIGSIFSNLLLVLGMCFFCGGVKYEEQSFISQGAVASIALLAFNGLTLLLPQFFGEEGDTAEEQHEVELTISRIGALALIIMYGQLLLFQLKTHVGLFEGEGDDEALIPFSWALTGLILITGVVTILSEWLVGSIDGFCVEFNLGRSFVGVIILPVVGNAVEHISAVSVAMKDKMDLALGVALGSSVQIGLFVLPMVVVVGWATGKDMSMKFPSVEVYLYLLSVIIVSLCLSNERSNWLEGSLLVFTYLMIGVGIYYEKDVDVEFK